ncbi:MAG: sulfatase-like hydrolase/transferase [Fuerstiella sp.]|nr:sulfatase-like hydrolase/transferase [Fuerstiella sp.]MCP4856865.1 sulfatase-like hydrolase/transferase [Fuerstiella sp.]
MMTRLILAFAVAIVGLSASASGPNIVFVEVDDLPAHYVGVNGAESAQTPTLDGLASRGVHFLNAVCQGTMCGPSRNSLIIGRYPHNIGMYENGPFKGLSNGVWTLPRALQQSGYKTAYIGKSHIHPGKEGLSGTNAHVRTVGHRQLGFDHVWQSMGRAVVGKKEPERGVDSYVDFLLDQECYEQMKADRRKPTTLPDDVYLDGLFTKLAEEYIAKQDEPYFLWLNYSVPHGPYDVKQDYHDRFNDAPMPEINARDDSGEGIPALLRPHQMDFSKVDKVQRGNCANIAFMDDQLGKVLAAIEASGKSDNTIVVFFSDHGILIGEHGLEHKATFYREVLNPTLIIYDPRQESAKRITQPVQLLDLVKTTLDWAGASAEEKAVPYGDTLLPLIEGNGTFARDYAVGECPGYYAMVTERYKYIAPFQHQEGGQTLLFDLKKNPEETLNIVEQHPELVEAFKRKANVWLAQSGEVLMQPTKR